MTTETQPLTPIDVFAPWAGAEERALRLRLHKAQHVATARASTEELGEARELYWLAGQVCSAWVFRRTDDLAQLEHILAAAGQMFMAANRLRVCAALNVS